MKSRLIWPTQLQVLIQLLQFSGIHQTDVVEED